MDVCIKFENFLGEIYQISEISSAEHDLIFEVFV